MADVTQPEQAKRLMAEAAAAFGGIDILVNNAALRRETPFAELSFAEWREVFSVILDGAFLCSQAALPYLKVSGASSLINIGGMSAHIGATARAHVIAAKSGLVGLTRALAHDLAEFGITANCVVPGMIDTVRGSSTGGTPSLHAAHKPLVGRRGTSEEIAGAVRYLVSPQARYVTGQTLHVNGGVFLP
jgi:3-oxoacyl-[acyl-carrier protein] reductase